ncbi:hypothetical protein BCR34DRAFT_568309 [Clohesyomyces aquaticus]|uniref:Uncharacterized protein n=1 Tax=Clohesyomyces aquaticus TaxID=1231657 RepID=A0A1Y1ZGY4_9PLEO|nr:hypothetical protein BCR34DRAFT_568309 [Clohesyomyces aquaticus]
MARSDGSAAQGRGETQPWGVSTSVCVFQREMDSDRRVSQKGILAGSLLVQHVEPSTVTESGEGAFLTTTRRPLQPTPSIVDANPTPFTYHAPLSVIDGVVQDSVCNCSLHAMRARTRHEGCAARLRRQLQVPWPPSRKGDTVQGESADAERKDSELLRVRRMISCSPRPTFFVAAAPRSWPSGDRESGSPAHDVQHRCANQCPLSSRRKENDQCPGWFPSR